MVSTHVQFLEVSAFHEPSLRPRPRSRTRPRPANLVSRTRTRTRTRTIGFMVPIRDSGIVEASHEPHPLIPSFSPSGGEGARRAVEGDSDRFMAPIRVEILVVPPFHEPQRHIQ